MVVLCDTAGGLKTTLFADELREGTPLATALLRPLELVLLVVPSRSDIKSFNPVLESHLAIGYTGLVSPASGVSIVTNCPTGLAPVAVLLL